MPLLKKPFIASLQARLLDFAQAPRARRWGLGIAIFLLLFGLIGFFAVPPLVHHKAEQALAELLGRPVSIGKISLNPFSLSLEIDQFHVGEPGGQAAFIDLDEFIVRGSWGSLLRLKPIIREVFLARLNVHVVREDAQTFNFSDLVEKFSKPDPDKKDSKPVLFSVSNIHMDDGAIEFDDRLLKQNHKIDQINLGIPFIANLPSKIDIFSQPFLQARIDGSPLLIEGKTKPFDGSFTSDVRVKLDQIDLPPLMSYAPAKLPVQLPKGKLSTDLNVRFAMTDQHASVELVGSVDLLALKLTDRAGQPLLNLGALHVVAESVEPLLSVVHLSDLRIDKPQLSLVRSKQGQINLAQLGQQPATAAPKTELAAAKNKSAPFDLRLQRFALSEGAITLQDQQAGTTLALDKLAVTLADLSTLARKAGHYTLQLQLAQGGSLSSKGSLNLADGKLDAAVEAQQLALAAFQPYLAGTLPGRLSQGTAGAKLNAKADWSGAAFGLQLSDSEVQLDQLRLDGNDKAKPLLSLEHAAARLHDFDLEQRHAQLSAVNVSGLTVNAVRAADGSINLVKPAPTGVAAAPAAPKADAAQPAWTYGIGSISLDKSAVSFSDLSTKQPVSLSLSSLQIKVQDFGSDFSKPFNLDASAGFGRNGTLKLSGPVMLSPLKLGLQVDAQKLDVAALQPYFAAQINASLASALLSAKGQLKFMQDQGQSRVYYKGDAGIARMRMLDNATSDLFAGWSNLDLSQIHAAYDPRGTRLKIDRITLDDFYSRILLNSNGRLNLDDFLSREDTQGKSLTRVDENAASQPAPAATAQSEAPAPEAQTAAPSAPLALNFGRILLHRGQVDYTDHFIKPNFSAHLVGIEGDIGAFGTDSTQPATVAVQATLNDNGPVTINGSVNPLAKPPSLDMSAGTRDVDLTNFSSYSLKYAGYPIVKGKLNVDLHYVLDQNKLTADNHIFIDQFTFGDHVDSPDATGLPVRLAISLLKNSRGEIDVDVPVSGSLDDPQFSVGSLIWHAFTNLIEKAVSSPFSLLAGAFGGGAEDLGYVAFDAGSASLSEAEIKKLDTIAKAMADKPGVKLDLTGRVDPALDLAGLKRAAVDRQIKRQKVRDTVGKGESVDIDSVSIDPAEYDKYLELAYKAASIKKPRNFVGLAKSLPADQMKQLLLDNVNVADSDLADLAQRRTAAVQQWFSGKIDAQRLFTVAPKLGPDGISDQGPTTRVEFTLE